MVSFLRHRSIHVFDGSTMYANIAWTVLSPLPLGTPQNSLPQAGVHAALPNSTIIPVSAGS